MDTHKKIASVVQHRDNPDNYTVSFTDGKQCISTYETFSNQFGGEPNILPTDLVGSWMNTAGLEVIKTINQLTVKGLLLDTLVHLKTGNHLHPTYVSAKRNFCEAKGIPFKTTSKVLLGHLGAVYEDNGMRDEFVRVANRYGYEVGGQKNG